MHQANFEEVVEKILANSTRYHREAYSFVREALDHTQKMIAKSGPEMRHVSGRELLEGVRDYAIKQYGPMAITVLNEWGVAACEDVGEIVFNMVEAGLLAKTETDSRTDFTNGYAFDEAFRKPFLPTVIARSRPGSEVIPSRS